MCRVGGITCNAEVFAGETGAVDQCFSTGGSRPKSGSPNRSEWVTECAAKEMTSTTKNVILNVFSDARLLF